MAATSTDVRAVDGVGGAVRHPTFQVQIDGPRAASLANVDLELAPDEVLVRTHQASVCDADLRAYLGMELPSDLPQFHTLGHEGGGTVIATGPDVRQFVEGDEVMLFGMCSSWSPFFKAPENRLHPVPEGLDLDIASLGEPTAVGMFGVLSAGVRLGDVVAVVGLNYQGLLAVQGLKLSGAKTVIAVDYSDVHLDLARKLGADVTVNTEHDDAIEAVRGAARGQLADVVFHSCGYWNPRAGDYFDLGANLVRDSGIFASIPDIMSPITANVHRFHHHAIDVRFPALMHHAHGPEFLKIWLPRVLRPVVEGMIDVRSLITASFPLEQAVDAVKLFSEDPDQVKIVLTREPTTEAHIGARG